MRPKVVRISTRHSGACGGDRGGRGEAVEPGHLDVEQRDVGPVFEHRGHDLVAAPDLGHDLEVVLERQQRDERGADERLVVGDQQPDRHGTATAIRQPPPRHRAGLDGAADRGDALAQPGDAVARRSPPMPPTPSSTISIDRGPEGDRAASTRARGARRWSIPSRTTQPNSSWRSASTTSVGLSTCASMPRRAQHLLRGRELGGEGDDPVVRHRGAHVGQRPAGQLLDLADLDRGAFRVVLGEALGEPGLDRDRRERVAEQVVQVAGDAVALAFRGERRHLGPGLVERVVGADDPEERPHRERHERERRRGRWRRSSACHEPMAGGRNRAAAVQHGGRRAAPSAPPYAMPTIAM